MSRYRPTGIAALWSKSSPANGAVMSCDVRRSHPFFVQMVNVRGLWAALFPRECAPPAGAAKLMFPSASCLSCLPNFEEHAFRSRIPGSASSGAAQGAEQGLSVSGGGLGTALKIGVCCMTLGNSLELLVIQGLRLHQNADSFQPRAGGNTSLVSLKEKHWFLEHTCAQFFWCVVSAGDEYMIVACIPCWKWVSLSHSRAASSCHILSPLPSTPRHHLLFVFFFTTLRFHPPLGHLLLLRFRTEQSAAMWRYQTHTGRMADGLHCTHDPGVLILAQRDIPCWALLPFL